MPPASTMGATKKKKTSKKKKSGGGVITIKPFVKPPSLPENFFEKSSKLLIHSTFCILRQEPLLYPSITGGSASATTAATTTVGVPSSPKSTLTPSPSTTTTTASGSGSNDAEKGSSFVREIGREELYRAVEDVCVHGYGPALYVQVVRAMKEAAVESLAKLEFSLQPTSLLKEVWGVYQNFAAYLACVRSIFLHLDTRFWYTWMPNPTDGEEPRFDELCVVSRTSAAAGAAPTPPPPAMAAAAAAAAAASTTLAQQNASAPLTGRSLWDVGMGCLRVEILQSGKATRFTASAAARLPASPAAAASARMAGSGATSPPRSILDALVDGTVSLLLMELDSQQTSKSLVRNIVCLLADLELLDYFCDSLLTQMTRYFTNESAQATDATHLVQHVDARLRQATSMATYYFGPHAAMDVCLAQRVAAGTTTASTSRIKVLTSIVEKYLLEPHWSTDHVLQPKVLYPLLDDAEKIVPDIRRLYLLARRVQSGQGLDLLRTAFAEYGRQRGLAMVRLDGAAAAATKERKAAMVPQLLQFKAHLERLYREAFGGDEVFGRTVRSVLESTVNDEEEGGKLVAELLAKHVDLRFKNAKATTLSSEESFQSQVLALFRHLHSKDVFEAFYRRDLAKRLLSGRSTSDDAEKAFISKLKAECGGGYTSKMEGMYKDMDLSRDVMGSYAAHAEGKRGGPPAATSMEKDDGDDDNVGGQKTEEDAQEQAEEKETSAAKDTDMLLSSSSVDMDVRVLTTGYWPVYPQYNSLILPESLATHQAQFESYYRTKYQGRRIAWQHSLAQCHVRANFPRAPHRELLVSLLQALVLLCFNTDVVESGRKGLTSTQVMKQVGLDDAGEMERLLQSLSMGRDGTNVLTKCDYDHAAAGGKDQDDADGDATGSAKRAKIRRAVGLHDRFQYNAFFSSNLRRIRIMNIQLRETAQERHKTHETVSRDRLYLIDAAIVRIMKARKTLEHAQLVGEVLQQVKFPAKNADVKKRIEGLLEREYLERAPNRRSCYNYLA